MLLTILAFLAVFSLLVFAHELGHFLVAKWRGVKVEEFGFGYPPRLFTIMEIGGTELTVNAIPFGGFVRFPGENDPTVPDGLASQGWRVRGGVFIAGAVMNMVLAALLFGATALIGEPVPITGVEITEVAAGSPAEAAGMKTGDLILELDGLEVTDSLALQRYTYERVGQEVSLLLEREGERLEVTLTPRLQPAAGEGPMGIAMHTVVVGTKLVRYEAWRAIPIGVSRTFRALGVIVLSVIYMVRGLISPEVAGPIGIAQATGQVAQMGLPFLLQFTAFLSVNLALINLLPFPGLDGGRLAFVLLEALRGGRKVNPEKEGLVHLIGMFVLIGLVLVISYFDILRVSGGS
ncbi:MAG: M50 family metallopeptidase [Anaerolineae bacterium]